MVLNPPSPNQKRDPDSRRVAHHEVAKGEMGDFEESKTGATPCWLGGVASKW